MGTQSRRRMNFAQVGCLSGLLVLLRSTLARTDCRGTVCAAVRGTVGRFFRQCISLCRAGAGGTVEALCRSLDSQSDAWEIYRTYDQSHLASHRNTVPIEDFRGFANPRIGPRFRRKIALQCYSMSCPVHIFVMSTLCSTAIRSFSFTFPKLFSQ